MHSKRIATTLVVFLMAAIGLTVRLVVVSVFEHGNYIAMASQQQSVTSDVLPRRGTVYVQDAATGTMSLISESTEEYALSVDPANMDAYKSEYIPVLAKFGQVDASTLAAQINSAPGHFLPVIRHGLSQDEVNQLAASLNAIELAHNPAWQNVSVSFDSAQGDTIYFIGGVFFTREYQRVYPEGSLLSQVMGFVDDSGNGKYGFEQAYNTELRGYTGKLLSERDSQGNLLEQQETVAGSDGTSYDLSIDRNVQAVVEQDLGAEVQRDEASGGSVIVMNPKNGEIIAMASTPTYDPNSIQDMSSSQVGLFDNPSISYDWEPGSIFKPLVMAAAIDTGKVTRYTTNTFPESVTVDGYTIQTALRHAYGTETMNQVLDNSDNVAMVWVANKLGNDTMYSYLKNFGLGQPTGIDLANEATGELSAGSSWSDIDRSTIAFGQGVSVTPIQMVQAYSAFADGGRMVQPHVVHAVIAPDGTQTVVQPTFSAPVVQASTAQTMLDMMVETVNTAEPQVAKAGYLIGGKTGTAQIPDPVNGGYIANAYNHSFIGIEPVNDPRFIVLTKIDNPNVAKVGLYAEDTAVPLFGKISTFLLNYYQIPPSK